MSSTLSFIVILCIFSFISQNIFCQQQIDNNQQLDDSCTVSKYCQEGQECFRYFVVWNELKRVMFFNSQQKGDEIKENLRCTFFEKVINQDGIKLQLWYGEPIEEYFDMDINLLVPNNSKINIMEISYIRVDEGGLYSEPNGTHYNDTDFTYTPIDYPIILNKTNTEQDLRKELLQFYDKSVWPWTEMNSPCLVQTNIMFHKIIDVDLSHGQLSMLVWFRLRWNDPRLTWDPEEWNNITVINLYQGEFWDPDIEIWNSLESVERSLEPQSAYVGPHGDIFWSRMGQIHISCDMQGLDKFPYDTSECLFEVGSWTYDNDRVIMAYNNSGYQLDESITGSQNAPFAQQHIENVTVDISSYLPFENYPQNYHNWSSINYDVKLIRNHAQYTYGIIVPQALLTFISFGAFWLSPSSGERISFTITIPLAIAVYKLLMYQQLPASAELVFASKFSFGCFLFTIFVVIESIFAAILWWGTDPYFLSPWKSYKKLFIDMKEKTYWVDVIKAIDVEMTHQKIQYNSTSLSSQISQFVGSIRRPFSRNQQGTGDVEIALQNSRSLQQISGNLQQNQSQQQSNNNNSTQNINFNESANDLQATRPFQSDALVNTLQRPRPQVIQEENSESSASEIFNQFTDIEAQNITQNIMFPLQNVQQAQAFLKQVLDKNEYEYALKSYKRLCDTYLEQDVQSILFRLMRVVNGPASDFAQAAKIKYNEKWQKLSNFVDRICQFTVVPSFLVFVFVISFWVAGL